MKTHALLITSFIVAAACIVGLYDFEETSRAPDLMTENKIATGNKAVYMAGCQTHHAPVLPKVVYPTVKRNFVTRVCALEVFPPYGAVVLQHAASVEGQGMRKSAPEVELR